MSDEYCKRIHSPVKGRDNDRIGSVPFHLNAMAFFRQYIAPLFIFLIFLVALLAVTARAFLPSDMAQPAPIEAVDAPQQAIALPSPASRA